MSARGIELHGPWGPVFGPLDLDIDEGGVTVVSGQVGAARTALMMALCGRMRLTRGSLTVLGFKNKPTKVFAQSAIACMNELDDVLPSVTVRDLVTEQKRWDSPWYKIVPRVDEGGVADMCAEVFGEVPLPRLNAFVDDLPRSNSCCCALRLRTRAGLRCWWSGGSTRSPTTGSVPHCWEGWLRSESSNR